MSFLSTSGGFSLEIFTIDWMTQILEVWSLTGYIWRQCQTMPYTLTSDSRLCSVTLQGFRAKIQSQCYWAASPMTLQLCIVKKQTIVATKSQAFDNWQHLILFCFCFCFLLFQFPPPRSCLWQFFLCVLTRNEKNGVRSSTSSLFSVWTLARW